MNTRRITISRAIAVAAAVVAGSLNTASAIQAPDARGRFDALVRDDPEEARDVATMPAESLSAAARAGWDRFRAAHGDSWAVSIDRRSGAPLLVEGKGIACATGPDANLDSIAASLRTFIAANRSLLLADDAELVLDRAASGLLFDDVWQLAFNRRVAGLPVAGERYLFTIGHGNLISFGSPRWSRVDASPVPELDESAARARLTSYMGLTPDDVVSDSEAPLLELVPLRSASAAQPGTGYFRGAIGSGYSSALVWHFVVRVAGDRGTWVARVDAHTGAIRSFFDGNRYNRVKGGVYPVANDHICPSGCEQPNTSIPFADVLVNGVTPLVSSSMGNVACVSPNIAKTTLAGPYVKIIDTCGPISQALSCAVDLNLGTSAGADCTVPAGASLGNTHASRTAFHHLNRMAEHARAWLPSITWLTQQFTATVNESAGCLGGWIDGAIELGRTGSGCNNAGELPGVLDHEWGHGLDENDGGDWDIPTEAYADITSLLMQHLSCVGRGFIAPALCNDNGDLCLVCTGAREHDWDQRASHTPATPAGYVAAHCGSTGDGGPCGGEQHCEGHVAGESIWDLAVRDLPASGLDATTAWAVVDRLWYQSRLGSGGNAYNCSLPDSDGCSATSWFEKMRVVDDDDGNLANGTPHAGAIFAAFDRHKIACGAAGDASNQNSGSCPALGVPILSAVPGSTSATALLRWSAVPNAASYRILRNDAGCQAALNRYSTTSTRTLTDTDVANGIPVYYSVQAMSANEACDGGLSTCQAVTPQPLAGVISLDADAYGCSAVITVTVTDGNGATTLTASLTSSTETVAEPVMLTKIVPGSTTYRGTIATTSNPAASDGLLAVHNGDAIVATYIDVNDGGGGVNVPRSTTASAACAPGSVRPVADGSFGSPMRSSRADASGTTLNVTWDVATCSSTDHHILYGDLASVASLAVTGAVCDLGTAGVTSWTSVPAGSLWFVVVGDDNAGTEGSWGKLGNGAERGGTTASGQCGLSTRNNSGTCP